ncbi:hypothetical protein Zm00014a_018295 [Zea mays]|uniref:Uncharacterized protein n=2 Tax=Zea mays TaxID=4577 RepID=A0A3L6EAA4_MAIZE|nr:hypothetical protein Zm00014a_018295 [Zea mays]
MAYHHNLPGLLPNCIYGDEITITLLVSRNGFGLCARTSQCIGIISTRHSSQAYAMRNIHRFGAEVSLFTCLLPKPSKKLACNTNWTLILYMIISFPVWFSFATALLLYGEGSQDSLSETLSKEPTDESISDVSLVQRAAFYLSWVLCPSNDDQCEMLSNNILEISHSWARNNKKCLSYQITMNHRRKLQIPTAAKSEKFHVSINTAAALIAERWALIGAYLIFIWLDVVEDMSSLIFGCEDRCHRSVSQLRNKTAPYPAQGSRFARLAPNPDTQDHQVTVMLVRCFHCFGCTSFIHFKVDTIPLKRKGNIKYVHD